MMDKEQEMLLEQELIVLAEETSNTQAVLESHPDALTIYQAAEPLAQEPSDLEVPEALRKGIEEKAAQSRAESLFDMICRLLRRLREYVKDEGELEQLRKKAAAKGNPIKAEDELYLVRFYKDAGLTPSVWSDIRLDTAPPNDQTLFKLAIALRLNEADAEMLMKKAGKAFVCSNREHELILNLIRSGVYDRGSVEARIEEHRKSSRSLKEYFDNMYDSREEKKAKRIAFVEAMGGKEKKMDEELFETRFLAIRNDKDQLRREILRMQSKLDILGTNYAERKAVFEGEWKAFKSNVARKKQWLEDCIARLKKRIQELGAGSHSA